MIWDRVYCKRLDNPDPLQWNDVAILTLEDDVKYNDHIQPICLAEGSQKYVDNRVTVAGWGTLREGGSQPSNLMKVDVKVWRNQDCKSSYGSSAPGGITNHMLCASLPTQDSCSVSVDQLTD